MCSQLNGKKIGTKKLALDNTGNNTLNPLIEGFVALIEECDKFLNDDVSKYKRPDNELPHFYKKTDLMTFPFISKFLLFDIKHDQYEELKSILIELHREFDRCGVLAVRNKLEHKPRPKNKLDGFPTKSEIIIACDCIDTVFKIFVKKGVYPNVFLFNKFNTDKYNRKRCELQDYKGEIVEIKPTFEYVGNIPGYRQPQTISSIFTIGNSSEPLRFIYKESSEYLSFWKNFPRKK
jgi:hypothetical protein